ncbi:MAG TPA: 23S rRNA (uracil(1939)-C(5))-methyltransferase RlmD [Bacilli bacterium]|nr:23S rRNA (uracil(1939)-C(5))-methyltransferase RlmD [Bacilli bacterium]
MKQTTYKQVKATTYDEFGRGQVIVNKKTYGVSGMIPGEVGDISILGDYAKVLTIETKSKARVTPPCKVYDRCGSCQLQHIHYQEQLKFKTQYVIDCFANYDIAIKPKPIIGMNEPFQYRNKNQFGYGYDKSGNIITGLYEENTHKLVPVKDCLIQDQLTNELFGSVQELMTKMRIQPFQEDKRIGIVRYVLVKRAFQTNQTLVTVVTGVENFPGKKEFFNAILKKHPEITTLVQNINNRKTSVVLGDSEKVFFGKGFIEDILCGLKFRISSKSFYQINSIQTEKLYGLVKQYANLTGEETVIDTYSGIGTIGLILAQNAKQVYSVELNKDAHYDAISNAKINNIKNIQFFNQDATQFMIGLSREKVKVDVVIMDPTRTGSTIEFINALRQLKPNRIIYVSCEPATQARDVKDIVNTGYRLVEIVPVDMFPQTYHVETITLLSLKTA